MLDVARHFFSADEVKRYIDLVSAYKLNRLHLHLADDQGWRIEIKSWANLTTIGGATEVGGGAGGFYTQAQYADLVSYARDRFITIVPEIDMPGPHQCGARRVRGAELRRRGQTALHGHRRRLQRPLRREGHHLQVHRRRRRRDRRASRRVRTSISAATR